MKMIYFDGYAKLNWNQRLYQISFTKNGIEVKDLLTGKIRLITTEFFNMIAESVIEIENEIILENDQNLLSELLGGYDD